MYMHVCMCVCVLKFCSFAVAGRRRRTTQVANYSRRMRLCGRLAGWLPQCSTSPTAAPLTTIHSPLLERCHECCTRTHTHTAETLSTQTYLECCLDTSQVSSCRLGKCKCTTLWLWYAGLHASGPHTQLEVSWNFAVFVLMANTFKI